ncbi:MAG: type II toxin-antitoxin system RelE/ParE family toxin [Sulfuricellaceae bacterium]
MLETFKHKGLEVFFTEGDRRLLSPQHVGRIKRILDLLNDAAKVEELNIPGYELHPLKGDRKGEWSMKISGNWRIVFCFEDGNAFDVNLEDYH